MSRGNLTVFGGGGFIGTAFLRLYAREFNSLVVIDRFSGPSHPRKDAHDLFEREFSSLGMKTIVADAANAASLTPVLAASDAVMLLNADTGTAQSGLEPQTCVRENINALVAVAEAVRRFCSPAKTRVIFTSSRAAYGEGAWKCSQHGDVTLIRSAAALRRAEFEPRCTHCESILTLGRTAEDVAREPLSVYGVTKSAGEDLLRTILGQYGFDVRIVRYQNVYGPGQEPTNPYTGVLNWFSSLLLSGRDIEIYEQGHIRRDFIYVDDAARLLYSLLMHERVNTGDVIVVNGGSGAAVSLTDVACMLKQRYKSPGEIGTSDKFRVGDVLGACADMSRAESVLGFSCRTALSDGLELYADWFSKQAR